AVVLAAAFATAFGAVLTAGFAAVLGAGLAGLFFSALRAAALRAGTDGFDFATIFSAGFFDFATALAMLTTIRKRGKKMRALHHFEGSRASRETPLSSYRWRHLSRPMPTS